jgi:hypothetical protein
MVIGLFSQARYLKDIFFVVNRSTATNLLTPRAMPGKIEAWFILGGSMKYGPSGLPLTIYMMVRIFRYEPLLSITLRHIKHALEAANVACRGNLPKLDKCEHLCKRENAQLESELAGPSSTNASFSMKENH